MRTEDDFRPAYLRNDFDRTMRREPEAVFARAVELFELRDPNNVLGTLREVIQHGKMPMLVANHQSLSDGIPLSIVTSQLPTGFNLPIAASIDEGQQGSLVQSVNSRFAPILAQRNLFMVPVVTEGDVEKREMSKRPTGLAKLLKTATTGRGFAMFPEATVEGGRTNSDGKINGLVKPTHPSVFTDWVERFANHGADPVVSPVGIDGSYKVFNPVDNSFSDEVLRMLIGRQQPIKIASITLGPLIPYSEIEVGVHTDDFFMNRIASLLPPSARGAYSLSSK